MKALSIGLAQINVTVGDIRGNTQRIIEATRDAAARGADLIVFPEMAITGYPPEDLVFKGIFQQAAMAAVEEIAIATKDTNAALLVGGLWAERDKTYNSVFLIDEGKVLAKRHKRSLPNYGVFDEKRLFTKGRDPEVMVWRGMKLGVLICEEVWDTHWPLHLAAHGAELLVVVNASPYETGKAVRRDHVAERAVADTGLPLIYLNLVGGQDELVFDGGSFVMDAHGVVAGRLGAFAEQLAVTGWDMEEGSWRCLDVPMETQPDALASIYLAMVLGLRDYVQKNRFKGVVIGLSGGIDSGLTAAVAVDALGAALVRAVMMPSPYTSQDSFEDAEALAKSFGIQLDSVPITPAMEAYDGMLAGLFAGMPKDTTEENIQARIRGNLLMGLSNKLGYMVVTTGNKSEMSVGYATLYGDMCGGYSVLKDVYKTTVWELSRWRNQSSEFRVQSSGGGIPERMITKAPTAELRPNQKDEDSLPPYAVLDAILKGLIEERQSIAEIVALGYDSATVERVAKMIYVAEYKRRQSPPGVKITGMSFGRDRRYPITNHWIWQRG